ncbi:MAG TPA: 4a-hydroxytetrahydrobiopterin dehydratase [Rhizomicrobium sp.]|jgi:4a-hydroxytetrahydrobiopterin dehydratase
MPAKLSPAEVKEAGLGHWTVEGEKLHRELRFADFPRAFGFMASVATIAQAMDHHPEWFNVYSTVKIWLTTHDAGGITANDIVLARKIDELYGR